MSQIPPQPPHHRTPVPLNYLTPQPDPKRPAGNVPYIAQMAIGFGSLWLLSLIGFFMAGMMFRRRFTPVPLICAAIAVVTIMVIARARWRWRGFALGVLIGLGIPLLGLGLCLAALARR